MAPLTVRIVRDIEALVRYEGFFRAAGRARDAAPYFFPLVAAQLPECHGWRVLIAEEGEDAVAALICRIEDLTVGPTWLPRQRGLRLILQGVVGEILTPQAEALVTALRGLLDAEGAAFLMLDYLIEGSYLALRMEQAWPRLLGPARTARIVHHRMELPRGEVPRGPVLSRNAREKKRRRERDLKAAAGGALELRAYAAPAEVGALMGAAEVVMRGSYQSRLGVGFRARTELRARLLAQAERGELRAWVLHLGDEPVAHWIGGLHGGTFALDYLAFNQAYEALAPGSYLTFRAVELLAEDLACDSIDFGLGDAGYKQRLATHTDYRVSLLLARRRPLPALAFGLHVGSRWLRRTTLDLLSRTGLTGRLRRWRRRAPVRSGLQD